MAVEHTGDPAQAFEDLRAEVSVLRRAIEALPGAMREARPPDYSQDLAVLGKGLDEIGEQLETVLQSPALNLTPEQQGQAIAKAGHNLIREAVQKLDQAAQATERERSRLAGIVGQAWTQDRHFKALCWTCGVAFAVGLLLAPFVASVLPFGLNTRVAALVMRDGRWAAGAALMEAGNPQAWAQLSADAALVRENLEIVEGCRTTATKAGKTQRCALTVKPSEAGD